MSSVGQRVYEEAAKQNAANGANPGEGGAEGANHGAQDADFKDVQ